MHGVLSIQASTTKGVANTVHKSLSTCFRAPRKGMKAPLISERSPWLFELDLSIRAAEWDAFFECKLNNSQRS
jgi:hypothetical protein